MAKRDPGYVYLAKKDGIYKIGISGKPHRRAASLDATLVHSIKVDNMGVVEAYFHRKYRFGRVEGEWFRLASEEVQEFVSCQEARCVPGRHGQKVEFIRGPQGMGRKSVLLLLADEERGAAINELRRLAESEEVGWMARGAFRSIASALTEARDREEE